MAERRTGKVSLRKEAVISTDPVIQLVQTVQQPLYTALETVMVGKRGRDLGEERKWTLCGPATIALTHAISARTGIPIAREGPGPRLELVIALYDPGREEEKTTHTYMRYYPGHKDLEGHEVVWYIDPLHPRTQKKDQKRITLEKYTQDSIDANLAVKHGLFPPAVDPHYFNTADFFYDTSYSEHKLEDLLRAYHTRDIFSVIFFGKSSGLARFQGEWANDVREVTRRLRSFTLFVPQKPIFSYNA